MVRKILLLFVVLNFLGQNYLAAQFSSNEITYWFGSGSNNVVVLIDFNDGTTNECWAWGYRFDGTKTAADMMAELAGSDPQLTVNLAGGFLNDINYGSQSGIAGTPYYWNTVSGTNLSDWIPNMGLTTTLADGDWFGCTYTDVDSVWNPIHYPENPMPAQQTFTAANVDYWIGTGANETVFVVDFNDGTTTECWAWGYRYDGTTTALDMMMDIADNDAYLQLNLGGGFLNDITYNTQSGIAGTPLYWNTVSGTNLSDWTPNMGLTTTLADGDWFGCTYTDVDSLWSPLLLPENPSPAQPSNTVQENGTMALSVYPNPANDFVWISADNEAIKRIELSDLSGRVISSTARTNNETKISLSNLSAGFYNIRIIANNTSYLQQIIKQ